MILAACYTDCICMMRSPFYALASSGNIARGCYASCGLEHAGEAGEGEAGFHLVGISGGIEHFPRSLDHEPAISIAGLAVCDCQRPGGRGLFFNSDKGIRAWGFFVGVSDGTR